jgi:hypothetical protein
MLLSSQRLTERILAILFGRILRLGTRHGEQIPVNLRPRVANQINSKTNPIAIRTIALDIKPFE